MELSRLPWTQLKNERFFPVLIFTPVLLALILQIIKPRLMWQSELAVFPLHSAGNWLLPQTCIS